MYKRQGSALTVVGFPALISLATVMAPWVDFTGYLAPGLSCFAAGSFLALLLGDKKPNLGFAVSSLAMLFVSSLLGGSLGKMLMPVVGVGRFGLFAWIISKVFGAKNQVLAFASRLSFPFYLMHHVAIYIVTLSAAPAVVFFGPSSSCSSVRFRCHVLGARLRSGLAREPRRL